MLAQNAQSFNRKPNRCGKTDAMVSRSLASLIHCVHCCTSYRSIFRLRRSATEAKEASGRPTISRPVETIKASPRARAWPSPYLPGSCRCFLGPDLWRVPAPFRQQMPSALYGWSPELLRPSTASDKPMPSFRVPPRAHNLGRIKY